MKLARTFMMATKARLRRHGIKSIWHGPPGARMHIYHGEGGGPGLPCVVLHGIGSNASTYAPLLKRMAPLSARIWAPELLGHGFSDTPEDLPTSVRLYAALKEALDEVIQKPVVLIGTSLGGAMALRYALERPDKIAHLILCSPAGAPMSEQGWKELRDLFDIQSDEDGLAFIERLLHRARWFHRFGARQVREMLDTPLVRSVFSSAQPDDFFSRAEVTQLRSHTLLIWGKSDRILPPECLVWFKRNLPSHVVFHEPERYGHSPHLEAPRDLVNRIMEFVGVEVSHA